jgi:hypothetical protein
MGVSVSSSVNIAAAAASPSYESSNHWVPVMTAAGTGTQVDLAVVWEGALACGGGHCVCLPNSKGVH